MGEFYEMADSVDIDLYDEELEPEFNQEEEDYNHEGVDLYDDVITASATDRDPEDPDDEITFQKYHDLKISPTSGPHGVKKLPLYVGNLTWWTTDQDITDAIHDLGITDLHEIKFYENRANGQSKGFCVISLGSEQSSRIVLEKLPKKELHGQSPVVTHCNRQTLNQFEMQSRKPGQGMPPPPCPGGPRMMGPPRMPMGPMRGRPMGPHHFNGPPRPANSLMSHVIHGPPNMYPPDYSQMPPNLRPNGPPPLGHHGPPMRPGGPPHHHPHHHHPHHHPGGHPPPPGLPGPLPPRPGGPPPPGMPLPHGMPPRGPPPDTRGPPPRPDWARPPGYLGQPPPLGPPPGGPPPVRPPPSSSVPPPGIPPPGLGQAPSPHVNPAFFPPNQGQPPPAGIQPNSQAGDPYGRPTQSQYGDYRSPDSRGVPPHYDYRGAGDGRGPEVIPAISETEFDEIMTRNRSVSSSAIARAVSDASNGEYASAIETLVTAISLIKQSKVSNDERCKILISSLQDTLHGIESKSYGSRSKDRPRSRERSRERERSSHRDKTRNRRERSRSREREYRERSRDRDRYHDDRYREKDRERERDREREHRSSRH